MRHLAINAGWMLAEKIFRLAAVFLIMAWIARVLGPESFGQLNLYLTAAASGWLVASLGLDALLLRDFSRGDGDQSALLSTAYVIRGVLLAWMTLLLMAYACFFWPESGSSSYRVGFVIVAASLPFYNVNTYFPYYQATSNSRVVTALSIGALAVSSVLKVFIIAMTKDFTWMCLAVVLDIIFLNIAFFALRSRGRSSVSFSKFDLSLAKNLLIQCAPLALASLLIVIYTRIDQFMLNGMASADELGIYGVGVRMSEAFIFLPTLVSTSFFPMISSDLSRDNVRRYFDVISFVSASGVGFLCLAMPYTIPLIFGAKYVEAVPVACLLLVATFFAVSGGATTNYFVARGMPYVRLVRSIVGIILGIGLNYVWIPKYGALGAAYAALVSQIVAGWLCNAFSKATRECFFIQSESILTMGAVGAVGAFKLVVQSFNRR